MLLLDIYIYLSNIYITYAMYVTYTYEHVCLFSVPTELPRRQSVIDQTN